MDPFGYGGRRQKQIFTSGTNSMIIDAEKLALEEWLNLILQRPRKKSVEIMDYQFPTDKHAKEYVKTIHKRSEQEVKNLLRKFLIKSGSLGTDGRRLQYWIKQGKLEEYVERFEHARRLVERDGPPWEGNTWILDLLPEYPQTAIDALDAYFTAHIQILPDGRFQGLSDAMMIIRARYFDLEHPIEALLNLRPRDFEFLIANLYLKMKYDVFVTKQTRDGGYDVRASKSEPGNVSTTLIESELRSWR